ncbi:hypothetical protein E2C01_061566 [Portunus trituberculatus]|uniref:Uncharacterized protein n=1 Tax=Portunus trituberculatus TaxID=210409 RepID=A0A5B7H469_PORTR|nr:hypothetical protein [Portunus trituberculatus]
MSPPNRLVLVCVMWCRALCLVVCLGIGQVTYLTISLLHCRTHCHFCPLCLVCA